MRHAQMLSRKPFPSCCRCAVLLGMFVPLALSPLKPAARRHHRTRHSLGNDLRRAANQRNRVCRNALKYTQLWSINTQSSVSVIRHATWSKMPDSRPEKTKARAERDAFMETNLEIPTLPWRPFLGVPATSNVGRTRSH